MVDAEELAMKLKVDHDEKTALRIQFGTRATHVGLLSLYIAQSADFGQKLLQVLLVSFYSRSDLSMMMEEAWKRFNRRTLTSRVSKLSGLTWNLAEGSTRTQKMMMNGSAYIRDPPVVKRKDDLEKRAEYVLKKDLEHSCQTESYADCAIYVTSADTAFVTNQSKECHEKAKDPGRGPPKSAAERDKIRRREMSSGAPGGVEAVQQVLWIRSPIKQDLSVTLEACNRPSERSDKFGTEESLKQHLAGPRSPGYVRVRIVKFDMFSSSSAPRRQTEISTVIVVYPSDGPIANGSTRVNMVEVKQFLSLIHI